MAGEVAFILICPHCDSPTFKHIVGRVYVEGLDVNAVLVRGGYAWV